MSSTAALKRQVGQKIDYYKTHAMPRRLRLMTVHGIERVLDVGANVGQYGRLLRKAGYTGDLVSFEPLSSAFKHLRRRATADGRWQAAHMGLGDHDGEMTIHVSGDSQASSLRRMLPLHENIASYFSNVGEEKVMLRTLDSVWDQYVPEGTDVFLKLDTQGFEREVLKGAAKVLPKVRGVQIELSIEPLYDGAPLMPEMLSFMDDAGFKLMSLEYGFCHPETGQMLQADGVFFRPL